MSNADHPFITRKEAGTILVSGDWTLPNIKQINRAIKDLRITPGSKIESQITYLDTAGAALLHDLANTMSSHGVNALQGLQPQQESLFNLIATSSQDHSKVKTEQINLIIKAVMDLGRLAVSSWEGALAFLSFTGETCVTLARSIVQPQRMRGVSIVRHIRETGLSAIPIVSLIAFLISIVLAYQGASQLRRFGAEIFTIDMVAISVLREMGVLLTAIMIAGRSGSAFTAEIGMMKVNEEVDAMRIIGVSPFDVLVLPRLLALMITLPLLTFIADLMALLGGAIISYSLINVGFDQYLDRVHMAINMNHFMVGMIKAPIFAFFIAIVGCMRGMQVAGSAESIGRQTTASVVQSIFLVLLLDALFSILFTKLGV